MTRPPDTAPNDRIRGLLTRGEGRLVWTIGGISVFTNLLMLTGPIFMLQVYDRVLSSKSEPTLLVLFALVAFLYTVFGVLDHARARIGARLGAQLHDRLDPQVFAAALNTDRMRAARAPAELSGLQQFASAPAFMALFDFPWVPLFLGIIALLNPWLGLLACLAALLLAGLGMANIRASRAPVGQAQTSAYRADRMTRQIAQHSPELDTMNMRAGALSRWQGQRRQALDHALALSDTSGRFGAIARALRLFLQSAILAAGAWLVLRGQLTPGGMIAASIILGRALAPLDQLIGGWPQVQLARAGMASLRDLLSHNPARACARIRLPAPRGQLVVRQLGLQAQTGARRVVLRDVGFALEPGQVLGVVGASGAGKSSLAAALAGHWPPDRGEIRLDGARLDQYPPDQLGAALGFLPQRVTLFEGSLRDNIARLDPAASDTDVIAAAKATGAHDMILSLPDGYATLVTAEETRLSGGQIQRIGLARAFFGDPVVIVLDEPDASLDAEGVRALGTAITAVRDRGATVVLTTHRVELLQGCDMTIRLERGAMVRPRPAGGETARRHTATRSVPQSLQAPVLTDAGQIRFPWEAGRNGAPR
ncbi:MAG: type I secretion system permease/ATPase [Rhodobacteraceae bacterium]|nr:type I secretion system permease/ATPase [Paracoccaceae bacterium]